MSKASFNDAKAELNRLGFTLRRAGERSEYRVNFRGGAEVTAYYTNDLADALDTGRAIAAARASVEALKAQRASVAADTGLMPEDIATLLDCIDGEMQTVSDHGREDVDDAPRYLNELRGVARKLCAAIGRDPTQYADDQEKSNVDQDSDFG